MTRFTGYGVLVTAAVDSFGGLDVLVDNAYACHTGPASFDEHEDGPWYEDFEITLRGACRCVRAALPHLTAAGGRGAIVGIGSVDAERHFGSHAYSAAKAAPAPGTAGAGSSNAPPPTTRRGGWASPPTSRPPSPSSPRRTRPGSPG
ncbi:NADP-dependent 3-hydroxy acid dehydrogenase YdfG [Streptomyces sp. V3I8]|nr:NADP-dependent 3-hydroxy acid dehydrogenase YdfG [Streptomyces sp. V3I8]